MLYDKLGKIIFKRLFPVPLTDNGSEFLIQKQLNAVIKNTQESVPMYFTVTQEVHIR